MVLLESFKLTLGEDAHDFSLSGTDDQTYSLDSFSDAKVLVIIFMCNHCPYVQAVLDRMIQIQADYKDKGVQFVGINSNDAENYPEDSFDGMKQVVEEKGINFPYLFDESQGVARTYQAQCTPDIYVYDQDRKLAYHGRIDDNWQEPENVTKQELREALDALVAGKKPAEDQNPSMGCSIKWK
jgi:peroxiredoxin